MKTFKIFKSKRKNKLGKKNTLLEIFLRILISVNGCRSNLCHTCFNCQKGNFETSLILFSAASGLVEGDVKLKLDSAAAANLVH